MNFEFKKPVFSFKKNLAMLLAVIMCMGQFSVPVAAEGSNNVPASGDISGDASGDAWQEGDISGNALGSVENYAKLGEEITVSSSEVLDYVELKEYNGSAWIEKSAYAAFANGDITIQLYKGNEPLITLDNNKPDDKLLVKQEYYNNSELLFKIYCGEAVICSVNYTLNKEKNWKLQSNDCDFSLLPGNSARLEVEVVQILQGPGTESIADYSFKYEWQKEDEGEGTYSDYEKIDGATGRSYDVAYEKPGTYRCVVSCVNDSEKDEIYFEVYQDPGLEVSVVGSRDKYLKPGETLRLEIEARSKLDGVTIKDYKWEKYNRELGVYEAIPGATSNSLLIDSIGKYSCIVTDSNGNSESEYFYVSQSQKWDGDFSSSAGELKVNQSIDVETKGEQWCFYAITPKTTGKYSIYSEGESDPLAFIIDSEGYVLETSDDDGYERNFRIVRQLTGGQTYYLAVREYENKVITIKVSAICAAHTKTEVRNAKAATCTEDGYTGDKCCVNCGEVVEAGSVIAKTGHSFGAWAVTKQPTVFEEGIQARVCSVCGAREEQAIAKLQPQAKLNMTTVPLKVKQTTTLKINNVVGGDAVASFKSSNTKIATVTSAGKITAKKKGTATVTVTMKSGQVLKATVKVQTGNVKTTKVTANVTKVSLDMKKTFQLKTVVTPLTSKEKVTFKSSNSKIVTVSKTGKLTAKKPGKATITVQSGKKKCYVKVTVNPVKTTAITVNKTQVKLKVKKSFTLKTKLTPGNSTEAVTYKTSNKKVATVSSKGKITAKKAGTATITVKSGNKSVKVQVTVTKK